MQHGDLPDSARLGSGGNLGTGCEQAHGGIKRERGSQKADLRRDVAQPSLDLLVAFSPALLSKARVTPPHPCRSGCLIGHDKPTQGASSAHCDIGETRSSWEPLSSGAETQILLPLSAPGLGFLDPHHWLCISGHLLPDCPPRRWPCSVSQDKQRNRWMGPADRPGTAVPAAFSRACRTT